MSMIPPPIPQEEQLNTELQTVLYMSELKRRSNFTLRPCYMLI